MVESGQGDASPSPELSESLSGIADFAGLMPDLTRPVIDRYFRRNPEIRQKHDKTPVTLADEAVESLLRDAIHRRFPDHGIIGEEGPRLEGKSRYIWVIDPIDGTRAFSNGNPLFGTLIGVLVDGEPCIGVIDLAALDMRWVGIAGLHSKRNGAIVSTSGTAGLASARLSTTGPFLFDEAQLSCFLRLSEACGVVNYGGDCANYAHLASGWCDLVVEANLKAYDIMAIVPVVKAAGGTISQWDGSPIRLAGFDGTVLASATPRLHQAALEMLNRQA